MTHLREAPSRDLVVILTLALTLVHNPGLASPLVTVLVVGALIYRPLAMQSGLWFAIAAFRILGIGPTAWFSIDNHHYLLTYWYIGLGVALLGGRTEGGRSDEMFAHAGRWLLGLTFAVAVFWKIVSPDFASGAFFELSLVTDLRLRALTEAATGIGAQEIVANRETVRSVLSSEVNTATLITHPLIRPVARLLAIGTILLEGLVALCVLAPRRYVPSTLRNGAILAFVWTTYALAPVVGFAWVVLTMAVAQCGRDESTARTAHVLSFIAIPGVAYAFRLGALALPTVGALAAVALFAAYVHTGRAILRDAAAVILCLGGGLLLQTQANIALGSAWGAAFGLLVVVALRLAARQPAAG